MASPELLEITDLVRTWTVGGDRRPVRVDEVVARLRSTGQRRGARLVQRLPARDGVLDEVALDALVVRVHCELQRMAEEMGQGRRVLEVLRPVVESLAGGGRPVRVVDVGCGLGYTLRWLAGHARWEPTVELVGVDLDATLVAEAARLAADEGLGVEFVRGDAFAPDAVVADPARTVVISSGVLHHLRGASLEEFFAAQEELGVAAFAHWDLVPGWLSTAGAWVVHRARMREPLSRHDGLVSVRRAHPTAALVEAVSSGAPSYAVRCSAGRGPTDLVRTVVGTRTAGW